MAIASTAAYAFQEQQGAAPASPAGQQAAPSGTPMDLSTGDVPVKPATGTEVRIPGLGKLGVLPKMDFGLELLYGATEGKQMERERPGAASQSDDLSIRGTLKHRF